jgi:hypothetical protein
MIYASTYDMAAQLADDMEVAPCVAAALVDSLLIDEEDGWEA